LANNVFISGEFFNNTIGNNSYNNTFNDDCDNNQIGDSFYNNSTNDDFDGNIIGEGFNNNYITSNFNNNRIGSVFNDNTLLGGSFYRNNIGNNFEDNVWTNSDFQNNEIGNQFDNNKIYGDFYNNDIGNGYNGNESYSQFYRNLIGNGYNGNTVYSVFYENNIEHVFYNNTIGTDLTIGTYIFRGNRIGSYFENNNCYGSFAYNTIGTNFNYNEVQDGFGFGGSSSQGNRIGNDFFNNTIGEYFYNNDIPDNFQNNEVGDSFQWNIVNTEINSTCLSTGMLYDVTTVNVFKNKNGDNRLSYYDESDVLTIETLTEAPCLGGLNALDIPENDLNFGLVINPSFTLSSTDFTDWGYGGGVTPNGTSGFTTDGLYDAGTSLYGPYNFVGNKGTEINAFFNNNGLLTNSTGYIFDVMWGAGSSIPSGKVLMGFYGTGLRIAPINTSNNNWQTPGQSNFDIESIAGTFNFTATFILYSPTTAQGTSWC
jgi:hypothetical protein